MGRKKKIPAIVTPRAYGDQTKQFGISLTEETWDKLNKSIGKNDSASATLEKAFLILHGIWFGNADATVEHNGDPLHHAASVLESIAWLSDRNINELFVRIVALGNLMQMIRDQREQIEEMKPNIHVK